MITAYESGEIRIILEDPYREEAPPPLPEEIERPLPSVPSVPLKEHLPFLPALRELAEENLRSEAACWFGNHKELLEELNKRAHTGTRASPLTDPEWPPNPTALAQRLNRNQERLASLGIHIRRLRRSRLGNRIKVFVYDVDQDRST